MEIYKETKTYSGGMVDIRNGSYSRVEDGKTLKGCYWVYCRETFHHSGRMDTILFSHTANRGRNVAEFIYYFEQKLKHKKLTEIGPTNRNRISWVKVAEFWNRNDMRRSLFTALLRAGQNFEYDVDNKEKAFERALWSVHYLRQTKDAVLLFLKGHTWYHGQRDGWYSQFARTKGAEKLLTKKMGKPVSDNLLLQFAMKKLQLTRDDLTVLYNREKAAQRKAKREKKKQEEELSEKRSLAAKKAAATRKRNAEKKKAEEGKKKRTKSRSAA